MPKSQKPLNDGYYRRGQSALATFKDPGYYEGLLPSIPTMCGMKRFRINYTFTLLSNFVNWLKLTHQSFRLSGINFKCPIQVHAIAEPSLSQLDCALLTIGGAPFGSHPALHLAKPNRKQNGGQDCHMKTLIGQQFSFEQHLEQN